MKKFLFILLTFFFVYLITQAQPGIDAKSTYFKMMQSMENVNKCTFILDIKERVYDKMIYGNHNIKMQSNPFKVYVFSNAPNKGAEALYIEGSNNGKVLINPNRFPFFNLNLAPNNTLLRKHHHYIIPQIGFNYLYSILRHYENENKVKFYSKLKLKIPSDPSKSYYILEIDNNDFGMMNYKVMGSETITDIGKKFNINDQMILDLNRDIDTFDDVKAGQIITIPNSYARRILFYVDKVNFLPLTQIMFDNKGLYCQITFDDFVLDPPLKAIEFTRDYKGYNF